jgi:hypothetical protein
MHTYIHQNRQSVSPVHVRVLACDVENTSVTCCILCYVISRIRTHFYVSSLIIIGPPPTHTHTNTNTHVSIKRSDYTHITYEDKLPHVHITIFWDMEMCSVVNLDWRFTESILHNQGRRIRAAQKIRSSYRGSIEQGRILAESIGSSVEGRVQRNT